MGCYGLVGLGVVLLGRIWAAQWLLRLPAAGAVGLLVLVTLPPAWWQTPRTGWVPPVVLVLAAYGYLVAEARNHGVGPVAAPLRSMGVAFVAAGHAVLVSLIGLVIVAPSYVDDGGGLARLWRDGADSVPRSVLVLAAAWCAAVGVFAQILWEDRPVTAPLAHLRWRGER
jgi:hypothetical protein